MLHMTIGRSVFAASSQGTSPGTAALPTCQAVQELSYSPPTVISNPHSKDLSTGSTGAPFDESVLQRNIDDSQ